MYVPVDEGRNHRGPNAQYGFFPVDEVAATTKSTGLMSNFKNALGDVWKKFNEIEIVSKENPIRKYVGYLVQSVYFQRLTLAAILANSAIIAIADYSHVDSENNLVSEGSPRNAIYNGSDIFFSVYFIIECALKIIALGFIGDSPAYLSDPWNVLDFIVVIAGIVSLVPNMPNIKIIRTFRVLRPLKSISQFPALAKLINSLILSVSGLADVMKVVITIFIFFGIIGMQVFSGPNMHAMCRLTPYPVTKNWTEGSDHSMFRCLDAPNLDLISIAANDGHSYTKETSPWREPQADCYWPADEVDRESGYLCSLDGQGFHHCHHDTENLPEEEWRWCGADFDGWGNYRFEREFDVYDYTVYVESLNFGFYNFDHIGKGFLYIFQVFSRVNWWFNMYALMDSTDAGFAAFYTIALLFMGTYVTLQLIIATLEKSVCEVAEMDEEKHMYEEKHMHSGKGTEEAAASAESSESSPIFTAMQQFYNNCGEKTICWRGYLVAVVDSPAYDNVVSGLIIINTIILALDHYPETELFVSCLDAINFLLTICFAVDCGLKIIANGPVAYIWDLSNCFDGAIVTVSIIELATSPPPILFTHIATAHTGGNLSALRSFRLFRLVRLFKSGPLKKLFDKIYFCVISVSNFIVLVLLYLFVFTLIGMQFFANRMRFDHEGFPILEINSEAYINAPDHARFNYDDFTHSLITVFQTIALDEWNVVIGNCARANGPFGTLFPIVCMIIGRCVLFNMLVALLIEGFMEEEEEEEKEGEEKKTLQQNLKDQELSMKEDLNAPELELSNLKTGSKDDGSVSYASQDKCGTTNDGEWGIDSSVPQPQSWEVKESDVFTADDSRTAPQQSYCSYGYLQSQLAYIVSHIYFEFISMAFIAISCVTLAMDNPLLDPDSALLAVLYRIDVVLAVVFVLEMLLKMFANGVVFGKSTYFMDPWNWLDCFIALSSLIFVAMSGSGPELERMKSFRSLRALRPLKLVNKLPGLRRTVSALVKSIPEVGGVVVIFFLTHLIFAIFLVSYFRGQLRSCQGDVFDIVISNDKSMMTLLEWPRPWAELNDFDRGLFGPQGPAFFYPVSVGGHGAPTHHAVTAHAMEFHRSTLAQPHPLSDDHHLTDDHHATTDDHHATNDHSGNHTELTYVTVTVTCQVGSLHWPDAPCAPYVDHAETYMDAAMPTSRMICEIWGAEWRPFHVRLWDNVGQALVNLFQLSTEEGWVLQMYASVDSRGIDMQPIRDFNIAWAYFFIVFMVVGSFFALELFVGAISESFYKNSKLEGANVFMTPEQIQWGKTKRMILRIKPLPFLKHPPNIVSQKFFWLCQHPVFENVVALVVVLQCVLLLSNHFGQSDETSEGLKIANAVIGILFFVEFIMKLIAFGAKGFFSIRWNRVEAVIAIVSLAGVIDIFVDDSPLGLVGNLIRILRAARLLRLMSQALRELFAALVVALPGILNVIILFILVLYIFTCVGMSLFAKIGYNHLLDIHGNFRTFGMGFLTLTRFTAGGGWDDYMYDAAEIIPGCVHDPQYDPNICGFNDAPGCIPLNGCGQESIFPFLLIFTMIVTFVLLNLFIGVVLSEFEDVNTSELKADDLQRVADLWSKYDPDAHYYMDKENVELFVAELYAPLGFGGQKFTPRQMNKRIGKARLYMNGRVHFSDVIFALTSAYYERKVKWAKIFSTVIGAADKEAFQASQINPVASMPVVHIEEPRNRNMMYIQGRAVTLNDDFYVRKVQSVWKAKVAAARARREAGDRPTTAPAPASDNKPVDSWGVAKIFWFYPSF